MKKIKEVINNYFNEDDKVKSWTILYYTRSNVVLTKVESLLNVNDEEDEIIELHIFNESKEVRYIFDKVSVLETQENEEYLDDEMYLNDDSRVLPYKKIKVRNLLDYTSDGIIYVKETRYMEVN